MGAPGDEVGGEPPGESAASSPAGADVTTSVVGEDLRVAEDSLVDTIALTPSGGLMPDPFLPGGRPGVGEAPEASAGGEAEAAPGDSFVKGVFQAGPLAIGGLVASGLNIVATVLIARLLTPRQYGGVAQLLGLFFVLSMPGSALLVGVVRRIAAGAAAGAEEEVHQWTNRLARRCLIGLAVWTVFALAIEQPLASALRLPSAGGVAAVLIAGGVWLLLCLYRAILQGHRRYAGLGLNLIVEIAVRVVLVLGFASAGFGIPGFALGLLLGEIVATVHARVLARRAWDYPVAEALAPDVLVRDRTLSIDLSAAFVGFVLLGVLQNADIILVGRLDPRARAPTRPSPWPASRWSSGPSSSAATCCPRRPSAGIRANTPSARWPCPWSSCWSRRWCSWASPWWPRNGS